MKKIVKGVSIVSFALLLFACGKKTTNSTTNKTTSKKNNTKLTTDVTKVNSTATKITTSVGKCTVTFDSKGGSNVDSQEIKKGGKIERPLDPKMEGYTFSDWYYNDEKWSFDNVIDSNITLEAKWTINSYTLTLNTNSEQGSVTGANTYDYNSDVTIKATPKTGYEFVGWYKDGEKTSYTQEQTFKMPSSDLTLEARWTIGIYTLTLNTNSEQGSVTGANTYEYNSDVTIKATPKDGYVFEGWYIDGVRTEYNQEDTFKMPSNDLTLEAKFIDNLDNFILDSEDPYKVIGVKNTNVFDLIIPKTVTSIGVLAFQNCVNLTSVTIGEGITSLYAGTFYGCTGLTTVTISSSVTFIERCIFEGCNNLSTIKVDPNNKVYDSRNDCNAIIKKENNELIAGCKTTVIPNSVTSLGESAFQDIDSITSMIIPKSIISIGNSVFNGCDGLKSIEIPNSVKSIGESAFAMCVGLENIEIPNSVTSIGNNAFEGCEGLKSIEIPNSVTILGDSVFSFCTSLTSVIIPDSITSIGGNVFFSCKSLTSIKLPNSITIIGDFAFYECESLKYVIIPTSVTSIGTSNFVIYDHPFKVFYEGTQLEWENVSIGSDNFAINDNNVFFYSDVYQEEVDNCWHYVVDHDEDGNEVKVPSLWKD